MLKLVGANPDDFTELEWSRAIAKLSGVVKAGQVRAFTGNEYIQDLTAGNIVACEAWSGDVIQAQFDNPDIKFVVPEEGLALWSDNMLVPNQAAAPRATPRSGSTTTTSPRSPRSWPPGSTTSVRSKGPGKRWARSTKSLVDNKLIFPSDEDLKDTFDFMALDDQQTKKYEGDWSDVTGG